MQRAAELLLAQADVADVTGQVSLALFWWRWWPPLVSPP